MSKFKFITLSILGILTIGLVSGCGPKEDIPTEFSRTNPRIIDEISLESEPVKLKKPFTILTEEGETPEELKYESVTLNTNEFENLYEAIRIAGQNATNSNKLQVQDANFTQVFIRQRASNWFVFDGHDYVGTDASKGAKEYIDANSAAYAITGSGSQYAYLGREDYVSEMSLQENKLELIENSNTRKLFLKDAILKIKDIIKNKKHSLTFGIRPEHILVNEKANSLKMNAYLNVVELLGNEYYFHFSINKFDVSIKTPKDKSYVSNTYLDLYFDLDKKHLFDDISEEKII